LLAVANYASVTASVSVNLPYKVCEWFWWCSVQMHWLWIFIWVLLSDQYDLHAAPRG